MTSESRGGENKREVYDCIVVGAGPAGLTAAIYLARYRLKCIVVGEVLGGKLSSSQVIDNYPGLKSIRGSELARMLVKHVESCGVPIVREKVTRVSRTNELFEVKLKNGAKLESRAVIIAIGCRKRKLGVKGEDLEGVSYCAVCDAPSCKGSNAVAVVGGGDLAVEGALILSEYAGKVYLIHRKSKLKTQQILAEELSRKENVELILNSIVEEIEGDDRVKAVVVRDKGSGLTRRIQVDAVFIEIGFEPYRDFHEMLGVDLDDKGYIKVNEYMETSVKGLFAAGECTSMWREFRRIITAEAQGGVAAYSVYKYLMMKRLKSRV